MAKKVRSEREFRERAFRGAKVEDVILYTKEMVDLAVRRMNEAETEQMKFYYEAQKNTYENMLARMVQDFQYDEVLT